MHQVPGSVEPLAYYVRRETHIPGFLCPGISIVRPARTYSNWCKSPNCPDSGKVTAKGKGVHREVESEGSRRQAVGPMNKNSVEGWKAGVMLQWKQKPDNYPNIYLFVPGPAGAGKGRLDFCFRLVKPIHKAKLDRWLAAKEEYRKEYAR